MTEGEQAPGSGTPVPRASDLDRERVVRTLRRAAGAGAIDLDELEARLGDVYAAKTLPELAALTVDLPPSVATDRDEPTSTSALQRFLAAPAFDNPGFRSHFSIYVLTIAMLVGIWALSGFGHPWPFYPAAGWGIGVGSHYMAVNRPGASTDERLPPKRVPSHGPPPPPSLPEAPPVARQPAGGRFAVAMFVDVVSSTTLTEAIGDDGWMRVRDHLATLLDECLEREGGWVANTAGDGVLARFDAPGRAVAAAVEINRRLERQRAEVGFAPSVRIGVHSGDVVDDGDDLIGRVVNLAARVTSAAEPGQIVVTEHVADHLPARFAADDLGIHTLKGVSRPRHLLAVRWTQEGRP